MNGVGVSDSPSDHALPRKRVTLVEPSAASPPLHKKQRLSPQQGDDDEEEEGEVVVDKDLEVRLAPLSPLPNRFLDKTQPLVTRGFELMFESLSSSREIYYTLNVYCLSREIVQSMSCYLISKDAKLVLVARR